MKIINKKYYGGMFDMKNLCIDILYIIIIKFICIFIYWYMDLTIVTIYVTKFFYKTKKPIVKQVNKYQVFKINKNWFYFLVHEK